MPARQAPHRHRRHPERPQFDLFDAVRKVAPGEPEWKALPEGARRALHASARRRRTLHRASVWVALASEPKRREPAQGEAGSETNSGFALQEEPNVLRQPDSGGFDTPVSREEEATTRSPV